MTQITLGWIDLDAPETFRSKAVERGRTFDLTVYAMESTLAATLWVREQLLALPVGVPLPLMWADDPRVDSFVIVDEVSLETQSLVDGGVVVAQLGLTQLGGPGEVVFQSLLTGTVHGNDAGVDATEAAPFHAPPGGHYAYSPYHSTYVDRASEDGTIRVYTDVDWDVDPVWQVEVADFYNGGCRLHNAGRVVTGQHVAAPSATDWALSNGLVRLTPNGTNLRFDLEVYDGADWGGLNTVQVHAAAAEVTGSWKAPYVLKNTPEEVVVRLEADTAVRLALDLSLRRGSRFVAGYLTRADAADLEITFEEGGASVTPTGAASVVAVVTTATVDGHRQVVGAATASSRPTATTGVVAAASTTLDVFLGQELDGASAVAGDTAADLSLQYLGWLGERVAVR